MSDFFTFLMSHIGSWITALITVITAVACSTSPTGRKQFIAVSDGEMNKMGLQAFGEMKAALKKNKDDRITIINGLHTYSSVWRPLIIATTQPIVASA